MELKQTNKWLYYRWFWQGITGFLIFPASLCLCKIYNFEIIILNILTIFNFISMIIFVFEIKNRKFYLKDIFSNNKNLLIKFINNFLAIIYIIFFIYVDFILIKKAM